METAPWWETYFDDLYLQLCQALSPADRETDAQQARAATAMLGLAPPAWILDLCCGAGRHAIPLARMGFIVNGLDYSNAMLAQARRDAARLGVDVDFHQGDMRDLPWGAVFDGCVMLGGSFGVLENETEHQKVLFAIADALKPGRRFLLDVANRDKIVREYAPYQQQQNDGFQRHVAYRFDSATNVSYAKERWLKDGQCIERTHARRLYTATELDEMLRYAGLTPIRYYGGYDQSALTPQSNRILVVAEKTKSHDEQPR
jgi:SAM-dependent methyltransferase